MCRPRRNDQSSMGRTQQGIMENKGTENINQVGTK